MPPKSEAHLSMSPAVVGYNAALMDHLGRPSETHFPRFDGQKAWMEPLVADGVRVPIAGMNLSSAAGLSTAARTETALDLTPRELCQQACPNLNRMIGGRCLNGAQVDTVDGDARCSRFGGYFQLPQSLKFM